MLSKEKTDEIVTLEITSISLTVISSMRLKLGMSLHDYAPNTDAAKAYADIALEVMRCG
mgnify:CR=1 FL=1